MNQIIQLDSRLSDPHLREIIIGSAIGLLGIVGLKKFGLPIPGNVYFLDQVPVLFQWTDFTAVVVMTLVISVVTGLWPSYEASRLKPVEIFRYE